MRRTLSLRKETLTQLTADDLAAVAGGNTPGCPITIEVDRIISVVTTLTTVTGDFTFQCTGNC